MTRSTTAAFTVSAWCAFVATSSCNCTGTPPAAVRESPPLAASPAPPPSSRLAVREVSGLPEDPVLGRQAEAQWREHMVEEERERQLAYDHEHLREHRAIVTEIMRVRSRYDRARTASLISKARAEVPKQVERIKQRTGVLDPWGVNSRLLSDYASLEELLEREYPEAKLVALAGDSRAFDAARARFDGHLKTIAEWLEATEEEEEEKDD